MPEGADIPGSGSRIQVGKFVREILKPPVPRLKGNPLDERIAIKLYEGLGMANQLRNVNDLHAIEDMKTRLAAEGIHNFQLALARPKNDIIKGGVAMTHDAVYTLAVADVKPDSALKWIFFMR